MTAPDAALGVVETTGRLRALVVGGSFLLTALLGLLISHRAYTGYRRNRSKPMLYLAVGLVLVTAVPPFVSLALANLTALPGWLVVLAMTASQICGLLCVLYSLYGDFRTTPPRRSDRS
jgi:phosphoglycerol transferase MdoB-like AlkP superfamily enzyme